MFTRGLCSCGCLRALVLARLLGVVGQCGPAAPHYAHCLLAGGVLVLTPLVWALLACARLVRAGWAEGGQVGAGQSCPAPLRALVALSTARCVRVEGEKGWG